MENKLLLFLFVNGFVFILVGLMIGSLKGIFFIFVEYDYDRAYCFFMYFG